MAGAAPTASSRSRRRASRLGAAIAFHPSDPAHTTRATKTDGAAEVALDACQEFDGRRRCPARPRQMMHPEPEADCRERRDEYEITGRYPLQPRKAPIERQTLREGDPEEHQRGRQDLIAKRAEAYKERLKQCVSSEHDLGARDAGTDVRWKAEEQYQQQPGRTIADTNGRDPEAEREADDRQDDELQHETDVRRKAERGVGDVAIRSKVNRQIAGGSVPGSRRAHLYLHAIPGPRLAKGAVVDEEPVDRPAVHGKYDVANLHSHGLCFGL